jgi:Bacterial tandem repeat domain 1
MRITLECRLASEESLPQFYIHKMEVQHQAEEGNMANNSDRYAAIWEKADGPAWQARHGLTSAQYQQAFDQLLAEGYRLKCVSGYAITGEDRYAAIWEKADGPAWQARHGLTSTQYQQAFDQLLAEGYRLKYVSGYAITGEDRYAAIWEKADGPAWQARHGLTSAQYQQAFDQLLAEGYRLKCVSGYSLQMDAIIVPFRRNLDPNLTSDQRISVVRYNGIDWQMLTTLSGAGSAIGPAVTVFRNQLFMAWRGVGADTSDNGDQGIYRSTSTDGSYWEPQQSIAGIGSLYGPNLAVFKDHLYMVWRGINDDQDLYWSRTSDGEHWDPQQKLGGATFYLPELLVFKDKLIVIWRGIIGDQSLYYSINHDGTSWGPQQPIPNKGSRAGVGLAMFHEKAVMVWPGIEDDQTIYWAQSDDGENWSDQKPIQGIGTYIWPSLITFGNRLFMIWRGIDGDWTLYWTWKEVDGDWQLPQQKVRDSLTGEEIFDGGRVSSVLFSI